MIMMIKYAEEQKEECPFCHKEIPFPIDEELHVKEHFPQTATYARAHKECVPAKGFKEWLDNDWLNAQPDEYGLYHNNVHESSGKLIRSIPVRKVKKSKK